MRDDPRDDDPVPQIAARELGDRLQGSARPLLVDVREDFELRLARIPDAVHIPLRELPLRTGEIPRDRPIVVLCHHGIRSAWATQLLRGLGYEATNLRGGIDAYAHEVDPSVGRY